jgi:hypothetical protein
MALMIENMAPIIGGSKSKKIVEFTDMVNFLI